MKTHMGRTSSSKLMGVGQNSSYPTKNHKGKHHLLMIFHIRKGLLALLANRPFLIWKIISRWAFPYGFWWRYSLTTKLMGVRSFDEFWRGSWKLMGVIRRMRILTFSNGKDSIFRLLSVKNQWFGLFSTDLGTCGAQKPSFGCRKCPSHLKKGKNNPGRLP